MKKFILFSLFLASLLTAQERKIKAGDAIEIVVYGHQEMSRIVTVSPDGSIDFPFMQNLPVDGITLDKLREIVVAQLSRYLNSFPVVTVSYAKANAIFVNVMGMVQKPGVVQVPLYTTLQGAIGAAGGFAPGARINEVTLIRNENGRMTSNSYDIEKFLLEGDLKQSPVLNEGDVVMVTGNPLLSTVKVIGAVRAPGAFSIYSGATILEMIMQAGGPNEDANMAKIRLVSPSRKRNIEYVIDLDRLLKSSDLTQLPLVKPGDVIFIPKKKNYWRSALAVIRDVSTITIALYYVTQINK